MTKVFGVENELGYVRAHIPVPVLFSESMCQFRAREPDVVRVAQNHSPETGRPAAPLRRSQRLSECEPRCHRITLSLGLGYLLVITLVSIVRVTMLTIA